MYSTPRLLTQPVWNNAFAYREGRVLRVSSLVDGILSDVRTGTEVVFEEFDDYKKLVSARGLEHFVATEFAGRPMYIFDNHNHALAFWCKGVQEGVLQPGFELVHIDMHSDLWENVHTLDLNRVTDSVYVVDFVDTKCNVGNYILPATRSGLVSKVIRIEWEGDLLAHESDSIPSNSVLNLDLDFFAKDLDDIDFELKKRVILRFAEQAALITVATSPYFINQELAIQRMQEVFG